MNYSKDFSKKTVAQLSKKGVSVVGIQAVPAFEGDRYFSGIAYLLVRNGEQFLRTYNQVLVMGSSSWGISNA